MVQMIHRRMFVTVALAALVIAPVSLAEGEDLARGEALFKTCVPCHGSDGGGNDYGKAPTIAGLAQWYVEAQLLKFRSGARGAHPDDYQGLRMRPMSRALRDEQSVTDVSAYIASLPPVVPEHTFEADAVKGKTLYTPCIACHGMEGQGNQALKGPPLTAISDWYLVESIGKFKSGLRGADPKKDPSGALMRPMAMTLADEQAIMDVVAYIRTLGN